MNIIKYKGHINYKLYIFIQSFLLKFMEFQYTVLSCDLIELITKF